MERPLTLTRTIIKTSAITLFVAFVSFSYGLFIFGYLFPLPMAKFNDSLGAHNAAAGYYERIYKAKPTVGNLYTALDRYIMAENHAKVVKLGTEFFDKDYDPIIVTVNQSGIAAAGTNKVNRLNWGNEDNRIKCAFTVALLYRGKIQTALARLDAWLAEPPDLEQPNHAYFAFVARGLGEGAVKELFRDYVTRFEEEYIKGFSGEKVFALDFLMMAYHFLGDTTNAAKYAKEFDQWLIIP